MADYTSIDLLAARDYIVGNLPQGELLAQLAEESAELTHAALKLRRVLEATNYTPVDLPSAMSNIKEEIADVWLLIQMLDLDRYQDEITVIMAHKITRWEKRLRGNEPDDALERSNDEVRQ